MSRKKQKGGMLVSSVLLLLLLFSLGVGGNLFSKWKSNALKTDTPLRYALYLSLNGLVGALFFLFSGGLSLTVDPPTLLFGFLCALCVSGVLLSAVLLFRLASVAAVFVLVSGFEMLTTSLFGALFFREVIDGLRLLRLLLMLAAIVATFFDRRASLGKREAGRGRTWLPLFLLLSVRIASSSAYSLLVRYYMLRGSADSHSLFFFTNVALSGGAFLLFLALALRKPASARPSLDILRPRMVGLVAGSTLLSNVSSLIGAALVLLMEASVLTPINSAITVLSAFTVTLLLRERCGRYGLLAALLALLTVLIPA